ncbi:MAG: DUF3052 domain-containing protein [Thermoplasmata archaeon]|jgi:hypothetical protein|nr:DUF3052 domain-containing protein [Thermoplasmata archaeon]
MAGYSDTPLPQKLGLRPGFRVHLVNEPMEVRALLQASLAGCQCLDAPGSALDFVMVFTDRRTELWKEVRQATEWLSPAGMLWACWPKKSSGVLTDLDEHGVRGIGLRTGLVDVKVCAVTETWSGLKFVRRVEDRTHPGSGTRAT